MTTDAFSLNFAFADDDKKADEPTPARPASSNDSPAEPVNEIPDGNSPDSSGTDSTAEADALDPFAGFSFGFENQAAEDNSGLPDFTAPDATNENGHAPSIPELEIVEMPATSSFDLSDMPEATGVEATGVETADLETANVETSGIETDEPRTAQTPAFDLETPASEAVNEAEVEEIAPIEIVVPASAVVMASALASDGEAIDANDPFAPFIKKPPHVATVAILGAGGIGKNHARWFAKHGCQIVSFLGTSEESNEATQRQLNREFGFEGQAFTSLEVLLRETRPEIVCVATPATFHFLHALESLESGAHVLCEKPLTYAPGRKPRENVAGAVELIKTAKKRNLLLGAQLQYGAATPILTKLADITPEEVGDFAMEIETTNASAPRDPRELWVDLGPHSVAVTQFLAGEGATLVEDSIQFFERINGPMSEASARFTVRRADERLVTVRSIVRFAPKDAMWRAPHRRFAFNGRVVSYRGYKMPSGEYAAQYTAPDGYDSHYPDPVDYLVGNFVRAVKGEEELIIDGEFGKRNLDWLLKINAPKS